MRIFLLIMLLISCSAYIVAQNVSPGLRDKINDIYNHVEKYQRTTPLWKQRYDAAMSAGNYYFGINEYQKAANAFNQALKIVPDDPKAKDSRDYCRQFLKNNSNNKGLKKSAKKSTLKRYYEEGGL